MKNVPEVPLPYHEELLRFCTIPAVYDRFDLSEHISSHEEDSLGRSVHTTCPETTLLVVSTDGRFSVDSTEFGRDSAEVIASAMVE